MSDLKLNTSTWDLQITNGDLVIIQQREALQQFLRQRLSTFLGEWFLNANEGVPYFQEIMTKKPSFAGVNAILKNKIVQTPGIVELESFELDYVPATRSLTLQFTARSTQGVIDFNEEIEI